MNKLTVKALEGMKPGIFAQGTVSDNDAGIPVRDTDRLLKWVAVRGDYADWAVYVAFAQEEGVFGETIYNGAAYVAMYGDKLNIEENIRKLVDCDDAAFERYRGFK